MDLQQFIENWISGGLTVKRLINWMNYSHLAKIDPNDLRMSILYTYNWDEHVNKIVGNDYHIETVQNILDNDDFLWDVDDVECPLSPINPSCGSYYQEGVKTLASLSGWKYGDKITPEIMGSMSDNLENVLGRLSRTFLPTPEGMVVYRTIVIHKNIEIESQKIDRYISTSMAALGSLMQFGLMRTYDMNDKELDEAKIIHMKYIVGEGIHSIPFALYGLQAGEEQEIMFPPQQAIIKPVGKNIIFDKPSDIVSFLSYMFEKEEYHNPFSELIDLFEEQVEKGLTVQFVENIIEPII